MGNVEDVDDEIFVAKQDVSIATDQLPSTEASSEPLLYSNDTPSGNRPSGQGTRTKPTWMGRQETDNLSYMLRR